MKKVAYFSLISIVVLLAACNPAKTDVNSPSVGTKAYIDSQIGRYGPDPQQQ